MEIEIDKKYICTNNIGTSFTEGLTYESPLQGYLTNNHNVVHQISSYIASKCFKPISDSKEQTDKVNHPSYYTWLKKKCGIEVIDIVRWLDFDKGCAVKYLLRSGYKTEEGYTIIEKEIEDLKKAKWYIEDKIKQLMEEKEKKGSKV